MRPPDLRDGDIYTLRREDDLLVKRLRRQGSNWLIVSDNINYPMEPLDQSVSVVGRVVWLGRTFRRSG
jgi:phage repressor protein C with HTH and peptisase S24 domain